MEASRLCRCMKALLLNRFPANISYSLNLVRCNSNRAAIAKTNRKVYSRMYPTLVVNTDGSTFRIKYGEPRKILKLPVDVNMLAADEKKIRLARYQPKKKVKIEDDLDDNFDANRYKHLWNKKK
ncbi:39S ribosomal protein L55, mitochondrial [Strongylocentrotus purpuratus]|uniref:39S ribosomal protein L55, mitochondrial n=1 Tax=Strongylocentrotus purpuratus TaxID=7668 RepID=A0A7M7PNU0_STRPU|nr:39S ribosomal protein L55, mitochondrial [Strongylocentrotus purpuratus]